MNVFTEDDIALEMARISKLRARPWETRLTAGTRIVIRALRIICGVALSLAGLVIGGYCYEYLSKPFAAQSFLGLVWGLVLALVAWLFFQVAWYAAFGEGPDDEDREKALRKSALESLSTKAAIEQ